MRHFALAVLVAVSAASAAFAAPVELEPATQARLEAGQRQRVIVEFAVPAVDYARAEGAADGEIAALIAQARDRVLTSVFGRPASMLATLDDPDPQGPVMAREFRYTPAAAMLLTEGEIAGLAREPGVARIVEDRLDAPTLDYSAAVTGGIDMHNRGFQGAGTAVAILDTGVDMQHAMFSGRIAASACFSSTVSGQSTSLCPGGDAQSLTPLAGDNCEIQGPLGSGIPGCEHGTHVAGIAVGGRIPHPVAGFDLVGMAPAAGIIAVKVFSRFNASQFCGPIAPCVLSYSSDQIAALEWIYDQRQTLDIAAVNMSLGGGRSEWSCLDNPRRDIIVALREAGIATVIATGNDGYDNALSYPACIPEAIAVGSLGPYSNEGFWRDLLAPGDLIMSAYPGRNNAAGSATVEATGTSMAAPHVAGGLALLREAYPEASIDQMESALQVSGMESGSGFIRVDSAADELEGHVGNRLGTLRLDSAAPIRLSHRDFDDAAVLFHEIILSNPSAQEADWSISGSADWVTFKTDEISEPQTALSGVLIGNASVTIRVVPDMARLLIQEYSGVVEIASTSAASPIRLPLRFRRMPALPVNDNFADAIDLNPAGYTTAFIDNREMTAEAGEPAHAGVQPAATQWWTLTPDRNDIYNIRVSPGDFDSVMAIYTGAALGSLSLVAQNNDADNFSTRSEIDLPVTAGVTYRLVSGSYDETDTGQGVLFIRNAPEVPANDLIANAEVISGERGRVRADLQAATRTPDEDGRPGATVWYRWTAPRQGEFGFFAHEGRTEQYVDLFIDPAQRAEHRRGETSADVPYYGTRVSVEAGEELFVGLRMRGMRQHPAELVWYPMQEQGLPLRTAIIPNARAVRAGRWATAFATLVNPSSFGRTVTNCRILPPALFGGAFHFQTTDPATNTLTGSRNAPVSIAAGQSQSFLISMQPPQAETRDFDLEFVCDQGAAPVATTVSAFRLVSSNIPRPDVIPVAVTANGTGILDLAPGATRAFAVAVINAGEAGVVSPVAHSTVGPDATVRICETDPVTGQCVSERETSRMVNMNRSQVRTFTVFVSLAPGVVMPLDPANRRVGISFRHDNEEVLASVAVRTVEQ